MTDRPSLLIADAATRAGVSRRTIYNWMKWNLVEFRRSQNGCSVRIFVDSLLTVPRAPKSGCARAPYGTVPGMDEIAR